MIISVSDAFAAVLAGIGSVSFVYFGFYLRSPSMKDFRFKPLVSLCFFSSAWSVCYVLYFLSMDALMKDFCRRCCFAGFLCFAYVLWFCIRYTGVLRGKKAVPLIVLAIAIPPLLGAYMGIFENAVVRDFPSGFWFLYTEVQSTAYNAASIILMLFYYRRRRTVMIRNFTIILCASSAVLIVSSLLADYYLGFRGGQNIQPLWLLMWLGILLFTIKKYRFMPAAADIINKDVMENIEEGIILLDPELRTTFMNAGARRLLQAGDGKDPLLLECVHERDVLTGRMLQLENGGQLFESRFSLLPCGGREKLPIDMRVKRLIDPYDQTSGYLVIFSRVKDSAHLRSAYGITERELDVMHQLAAGRTNRETAGLLGVSEKTVETHIASIYGKLMVKNRVELLKLISGYDTFGQELRLREEPAPDRPRAGRT